MSNLDTPFNAKGWWLKREGKKRLKQLELKEKERKRYLTAEWSELRTPQPQVNNDYGIQWMDYKRFNYYYAQSTLPFSNVTQHVPEPVDYGGELEETE